jgi:hypothetical protein
MPHLATIGSRIREVLRRWLPVDARSSGQHPDHLVHFVLRDGVPDFCCAWHAEHDFHPHAGATAAYHDHLSGGQLAYIERHLGDRRGPGPRR